MDQATAEQLQENQKGLALTASENWHWAKGKLEYMITALMSLDTLPDKDLELEIKARKKAAGIVRAWIEEIEGTGELHQASTEALKNKTIDSTVVYK